MSAKQIIEAMERRHQARLAAGNIGEWQTEVNEIYRALHAILERLEHEPRPVRIVQTDPLEETSSAG